MAELVCDSCDAYLSAPLKEALDDGWKRKCVRARSDMFVMCPDCIEKYAERRRMRAIVTRTIEQKGSV